MERLRLQSKVGEQVVYRGTEMVVTRKEEQSDGSAVFDMRKEDKHNGVFVATNIRISPEE